MDSWTFVFPVISAVSGHNSQTAKYLMISPSVATVARQPRDPIISGPIGQPAKCLMISPSVATVVNLPSVSLSYYQWPQWSDSLTISPSVVTMVRQTHDLTISGHSGQTISRSHHQWPQWSNILTILAFCHVDIDVCIYSTCAF